MMYRTTSYAENVWDVFWYEKNLQGDIIAVYNSAGTKVATYTYTDAWGNHSVSYSNGGASTGVIYNPFRYRSYYYDKDLGMYYLQSRYYDAKICRFISADTYVSTGQGILGNNMYAYCGNNPVNNIDPTGESLLAAALIILAGAIIGGAVGAAVVSSTAKKEGREASAGEIVAGIAAGFIIGGAAVGLVMSASAAIYIAAESSVTVMFLFAPAKEVVALGLLAYSTFSCVLLPLLSMEGEVVELGSPYNIRQPIIR